MADSSANSPSSAEGPLGTLLELLCRVLQGLDAVYSFLFRWVLRWGAVVRTLLVVLLVGLWIRYGVPSIWTAMAKDEPVPAFSWSIDWFQDIGCRVVECAHRLLHSLLQPAKETGGPRRFFHDHEHLSQLFGVAAAILLALSGLLRVAGLAMRRWSGAWFARRHVVVIGMGGAGGALLRDMLGSKRGRRLVVAMDVDPALIENARNCCPGALYLQGDARDTRVRGWLGVRRAQSVFISTGDDARNVALAGRVWQDCQPRSVGFLRRWAPQGLRKLWEEHVTPFWKEARRRHPRLQRHLPEIVPLATDHSLYARLDSVISRVYQVPRPEGGGSVSRITLFNPTDVAARQLFERHPIDELARLSPAGRAHLLLLGFDEQGEAILRQALQVALRPDLGPPQATILVPDPEGAKASLCARFPELDMEDPDSVLRSMGIRIRFLAFDGDPRNIRGLLQAHPEIEEFEAYEEEEDWDRVRLARETRERLLGQFFEPVSDESPEFQPEIPLPTCPVTMIVVAWGSDLENINLAFALQNASESLRRCLAPTYLRLRRDEGLQDSLAPAHREIQFHRVIDTFGKDEDVCTFREIFERPWEHAAAELHELYKRLRRRQGIAGGHGPGTRAGDEPLEALEATYKLANRQQRDCVAVKLRALRYRLRPLASTAGSQTALFINPIPDAAPPAPAIRKALAANEHDRWVVERCCDGWIRGTERDNPRQVHPLLVGFDDLEPPDQSYDIRHIEQLHHLAGYTTLVRGATGPPLVWRRDVILGAVGPLGCSEDAVQDLENDTKHALQAIRERLSTSSTVVTLLAAGWSGFPALFLEAGAKVFEDFHVRVLCCHGLPLNVYPTRALSRYAVTRQTTEFQDRTDKPGSLESTRIDSLLGRSGPGAPDSWVLDLFPHGLPTVAAQPPSTVQRVTGRPPARLIAHRRALRRTQQLRAAAFAVERSDFLVLCDRGTAKPQPSPAARARAWWLDPTTLPEAFQTPDWKDPGGWTSSRADRLITV